ncbi:hypothetical protein M405DRAFT_830296 [Rhizopogon salebrosus TDB-379]|nr:hypothetical protein M405DRAFT_830296 [Rhizopogon salebrosus TDB-379]
MPGMRAGTSGCKAKYEEASEVEGSESWTTRFYLKVQRVQNPMLESLIKTDWAESVKHSIDNRRRRPFGLCDAESTNVNTRKWKNGVSL